MGFTWEITTNDIVKTHLGSCNIYNYIYIFEVFVFALFSLILYIVRFGHSQLQKFLFRIVCSQLIIILCTQGKYDFFVFKFSIKITNYYMESSPNYKIT